MSCVLIYSNNTLFRESLENIVNNDEYVTSVASIDNIAKISDVSFTNIPAFIVIDLYSRNFEENSLLSIIKQFENAEIILVTTIENKHINYYHHVYGIKHYVHIEDKAENIATTFSKIFSGAFSNDKFKAVHSILTSRECEILKFIAAGKTSKEIAEILCISKNTVDTHRNKMLQKLNLANSASLVQYAYKSGLF